jgi:hypothetical protein
MLTCEGPELQSLVPTLLWCATPPGLDLFSLPAGMQELACGTGAQMHVSCMTAPLQLHPL